MDHFDKQTKFINEIIAYWRKAKEYEHKFREELRRIKWGWKPHPLK